MSWADFNIDLQQAGKKYRQHWIFNKLDLKLEIGQSLAILGPNGSGKSTLINCISGFTPLSAGKITYSHKGKIYEWDDFYRFVSWSSPSMELLEDLTLSESINFHIKLKPFIESFSTESLLESSGLIQSKNKYIRNFSSGMRQRLKLILSIACDSPLLLLDEPCTNLDDKGIEWYRNFVLPELNNRIVIVASNQLHEWDFCQKSIQISDFNK